jgi:hypothetical protein
MDKNLTGIFQYKKATFDQMQNEGKLQEGGLYFIRDFDEQDIPIAHSIYLGDRLYAEVCNNDIVGNDIEVEETEITEPHTYTEYEETVKNGGGITLDENIVNTQSII